MDRLPTWKRWLPWRGYGWLVPVLPMAALALVLAIGGHGGRREGVIAIGVATLCATLAIAILGIRMNGRAGRVSIDPAADRRDVSRRRHSLLWIPMQWWAPAVLLSGAFLTLLAGAC